MSNKQIKDSVAYYNGNIHTLSESSPAIVEAFIVTPQGTFHDVGTTTQILQIAKVYGMVTYDLRGRFVMPGIHDAHVRLLSAGASYLSGVTLDEDTTIDNVAQRMHEGQCACAYQHAFQDWMVGDAFIIPNFDRSSLDQDFPDTPIIIHGGAGHSMFLNTAGLIRAGYDVENEPDVKGARFSRRTDGSLTDDIERFREQNVTAELSPAWLFDHPIAKASNGAMNWDFVQLLEAQVYPITIGSDWGARGDPSLLPKVHHVVRRVGDWAAEKSNQKLNSAPSNKISRGANLVLEMLTKNGAAAVGLSEMSGSIEVGKHANFIMLDRDIVGDVGEEVMADFENVKVLKTWFEGELVWDAESEVL